MQSVISMLWEKELITITDAIFFADGKATSCKITSFPTPKIEVGADFNFIDFYRHNNEEVTSIDII
ncbi:hypothetical protein [Pantoea ananatis]|nr:hypothetical protein [Pantoea ananatis]